MKVKNRIFQIITLSSLICLGTSCSDDFFEEQAGNRIEPKDHFRSQTDLEVSIYGSYVPLQDAMPKLLLVDGLRSDLMSVGSNGDLFMKDINEQKLDINNPYLDGSGFYKVIVNTNEILKNFDRVWVKDPANDTAYIRFKKGEILNIRAWSYFMLARLYGKVAYINDNLESLPKNVNYLTKKDIIDTLIKQIRPYLVTNTKTTEYYFDGPNTAMLLGQMYLENDQYDSAAVYLKKGIESYGNGSEYLKLTKALQWENWKLIFMNDEANGNEYKDYLYFSTRHKQNNSFTGWSIKNMIEPSSVLVDSFKNQQQSTGEIGDIYRGKGITYDTIPGYNDKYYISKYALDKIEPYSAGISLCRAADLHLQLAEALNRIGDYETALLLVNSGISSGSGVAGYNKWAGNLGVRGRVNLVPRSIPASVDMSNSQAVMEAVEDIILEERTLELAFEGTRWFDLVRVAERRGPAYLADKVVRKYADPTVQAEVHSKLMNQDNWYLPLR